MYEVLLKKLHDGLNCNSVYSTDENYYVLATLKVFFLKNVIYQL